VLTKPINSRIVGNAGSNPDIRQRFVGGPETGFADINGDLPEADFRPGTICG
jgi:hypothetical protein